MALIHNVITSITYFHPIFSSHTFIPCFHPILSSEESQHPSCIFIYKSYHPFHTYIPQANVRNKSGRENDKGAGPEDEGKQFFGEFNMNEWMNEWMRRFFLRGPAAIVRREPSEMSTMAAAAAVAAVSSFCMLSMCMCACGSLKAHPEFVVGVVMPRPVAIMGRAECAVVMSVRNSLTTAIEVESPECASICQSQETWQGESKQRSVSGASERWATEESWVRD